MDPYKEMMGHEDSLQTKMANHARRNPFLMAGFASLIAVVAVGAYKFKQRGDMPVSLYLLQFRVLAQGSLIGCLTIGMTYHMFNDHLLPRWKKE